MTNIELVGGYRVIITTVTGPSSYTSGGVEYTINELDSVVGVIALPAGGYLIEASVVEGTNRVKLVFKHFDYPATAAGPAVEVPDGTDLSGVTVTLIVIGV